ncbi:MULTISPECIES: hypothetical protein [unclassified Mesorhizobium]|nr:MULTISPECIES: hypothetical protein [unclassified Mesorhizobium]
MAQTFRQVSGSNAGKNLFGVALDELGTVVARIGESRIDAAGQTNME